MKKVLIWIALFVLIVLLGSTQVNADKVLGGDQPLIINDKTSTILQVRAVETERIASELIELPPEQNSADLFSHSLFPNEITPPENCRVSLSGPFGKDFEIFRGGDQGSRYAASPTWEINAKWVYNATQNKMRPTVTAAAINSEQIVAVWEEYGLPLMYDIWNGDWSGTPAHLPDLPGASDGNPVVISPGNHTWEVYVQVDGQIQQTTWVSPTYMTDWQPLPGMTGEASVASDPAVIATDLQHVLVFYRDTNGVIRFTERQGGVWRANPLTLLDNENSIFLPLVINETTTSASSPQTILENNLAPLDPLAAPLPSELSAASRNANHAAVFYVDEQNNLWVNEWTHLNNSDWRDTHWRMLMQDVMIEKPAVASRHINHLAVAVRDTSGIAHVIEWTPDLENTGKPGWKEPYSLEKILAGPLALASATVDSLSVFGIDSEMVNWQTSWTADGGWGEWVNFEFFPISKLTAVVVRRPDDIMLLGWAQGAWFVGDSVVSKHFTSQGITPTESVVVPVGETNGYPRGQALAWVGGKTLWVTAHEEGGSSPQHWQVDALILGEDDPPQKLVLQDGDHVYVPDTLVYAAAADLDFDGDEEAVVATMYPANITDNGYLSLSVLNFEITPTLSITTLATKVISPTMGITQNYSLALGDLDGDGISNEIILARKIFNQNLIQLLVYKYDPDPLSQTLLWKAETTLDLDLRPDLSWEYLRTQVQVDTGKLYPGYPGHQIVISNLNLYRDRDGLQHFVFPTVRTYFVDTSEAEWVIVPVDEQLISSKDNLNLDLVGYDAYGDYYPDQIYGDYSSELGTGDLDADSYDEIMLAYSDRILTVEPYERPDFIQMLPIDPPMPTIISPDRSLAVGDIDRDGRAEIFTEMFMRDVPDYIPKLYQFEILEDGKLHPTTTNNLPTVDQGGRLHAILMGDTDNDSFIAKLTGCGEFGEAKIVAVLNGVPRWYANGLPINESRGTYSVSSENTSSEESGTKFNLGTSLSVGFEQEINVPLIGTKIGEVRASVTTDFMSTQGIRNATELYESWGLGLGFEQLSLGQVVYEYVANTCYFYDVYNPDSPGDISKAMACIPAPQNPEEKTRATGLENWHTQTVKDAAGLSWADIGHSAPNGSHSNDLGIAGNYPPVLPVDDFMLVYEFEPITIKYDNAGQFVEWSYETGTGGARTQFHEMELNTTVSAGATAFGVSVDRSFTAGIGSESSQTMSWGNTLAFYGRSYHFQDPNRLCYRVVPYVYQAKALTMAGVTYPYWEMDYYVTKIWPCVL